MEQVPARERLAAVLTFPRRRLIAGAEIDLYGGTAAAVRVTPRRSRWPRWEASDRLALPVALAALTLGGTSPDLSPRVRHLLMALGAALVDEPEPGNLAAWTSAVAMRDMVRPRGPGQPRISVRFVSTRDGPLAVLEGPAPSALTMASASAALAAATLDGIHPDIRLAVALSIEGVLIRHKPGRTARSSPLVVTAGLLYAAMRLEEAGRAVPHALLSATRGGEPSTI